MDKPSINTIAIKNFIANFIIPLVALGIIVALFLLIIFPSLSEVPVLEEELEQKQMTASKLEQKYLKLNNLLDFKNSVEENRDLASLVLVEEPKVPQLLTQIDIIAKESGLVVSKMTYSIGDTGESEGTGGSVVSVRVGVEGTYDQLISFMRGMENAGRVIDVSNVRYSYDDESGAVGATFILVSPYVKLEAQAVTDEPITFDLNDPEFQALMDKLKNLRIYDISIDQVINIEELEEEEVTIEEAPAPEEEGAPSPFAPAPETPAPTEGIPPAAE